MTFYRLDKNNNIIDSADFKYSEDCLETEKNIIRGFDGKLIFEEETKTEKYLTEKQEFETLQNKQKQIAEIKTWFEEYDNQVKQYERCKRLGIEFDKDIVKLDTQAKAYQEELRKLDYKKSSEYINKGE